MTIITITPIFYSTEEGSGCWVYNGIEAETIKELITKLGKGYQVEDYFPNGYTGNLTRRGKLFEGFETKDEVETNQKIIEKLVPITEEIQPVKNLFREPIEEVTMIGSIPVDYSEPTQAEVDAANASCSEVFETSDFISVNRHTHEVVEPKPIPKPKKKRLRKRNPNSKGVFHPPCADKDGILDMWAAGVESKIIAETYGVKNIRTIGRRVAWWRKSGDPRAVIRCPASYGKPKNNKTKKHR